MDFKFLWEHFKTARGALVIPGAVVGNHWSKDSLIVEFILLMFYFAKGVNVECLNGKLQGVKLAQPLKLCAFKRFLFICSSHVL